MWLLLCAGSAAAATLVWQHWRRASGALVLGILGLALGLVWRDYGHRVQPVAAAPNGHRVVIDLDKLSRSQLEELDRLSRDILPTGLPGIALSPLPPEDQPFPFPRRKPIDVPKSL